MDRDPRAPGRPAARTPRGRARGANLALAIGLTCILGLAGELDDAYPAAPRSSARTPPSVPAPIPAPPPPVLPAPPPAPPPAATPLPAEPPAGAPEAAPRETSVAVSVELSHPRRRVPARFLGLSFEVSSLPLVASFATRGDLARLLRSLGKGFLRFGGVSADTRVAWSDALTPPPAWASQVITGADLKALAQLAARSGWRVILTVGLAHFEPLAAAREVAAAKAALGPSLAGVEIGNEPDAYGRHGLRPLPWNFARFDGEVRSYRRAIAHLVRGVPIAGPAVSGSHAFARWGPREARAERPALLTGHHYPLGCSQVPAPTREQLLSPLVRGLERLSLERYMAVSTRTGIPFRMDEAGSVSCGGESGVSNTFASALWATAFLTAAMRAGVEGVNLQGNPEYCLGYSPLCATSPARLAHAVLSPQPVWYALLLARQLVGARPVRTKVLAPGHPDLAVSAFEGSRRTLQFVLVDDDPPGSAPAHVTLHLRRAYTSATILTLRAPSPAATSDVSLGERRVGADGSWSPPPALPSVAVRAGRATVRLAPSTAVLVTAGVHG